MQTGTILVARDPDIKHDINLILINTNKQRTRTTFREVTFLYNEECNQEDSVLCLCVIPSYRRRNAQSYRVHNYLLYQ